MRPAEGSSRDFGKDIIPYIVKNGKAWAHRFPRSCVRSSIEGGPTGATSARSTPIGRPISTSPTSSRSSISTTATGRSGPMPRSRRRPSSCMTRTAGAARRSTRWSRATASSRAPSLQRSAAVHRVARPFLLGARRGGGVALLRYRPQRAAQAGGHRPWRQHPRRAGGRRGSRISTRKRFRRIGERHVPDHPGHDRQDLACDA